MKIYGGLQENEFCIPLAYEKIIKAKLRHLVINRGFSIQRATKERIELVRASINEKGGLDLIGILCQKIGPYYILKYQEKFKRDVKYTLHKTKYPRFRFKKRLTTL